jgi:Transposase IS66 family
MNLPKKHLEFLQKHTSDKYWLRTNVDKLLAQMFPNPKKHQGYRKIILEASAIAAYRQSDYAIQHLIVDDAPQFKLITETLGLCWVHEGRHYKKLNPVFGHNKELLKNFIGEFWDYYTLLKDYKQKPSSQQAKELGKQFDELFYRKTGYDELDKQIATTRNKKNFLLLVLTYPSIPIHNNSAELIARFQARIRDIHLHTMSIAGTKIKNTLATITMTAKKLGVNAFDYLFDKLTKAYRMTSLAELIKIKSELDIEKSGVELIPS